MYKLNFKEDIPGSWQKLRRLRITPEEGILVEIDAATGACK